MAVLEGLADAYPVGYVRPHTAERTAAPTGALSLWSLRLAADEIALVVALLAVGGMAHGACVLYLLTTFAALAITGAYRRRLSLSALDEAPRLAASAAIGLLVAGVAGPWLTLPSSLFAQALLTVAALVLARSASYAAMRHLRRSGHFTERAVIVGAGAVGIELHRLLLDHPEYGLEPAGIIDDVAPAEGLPLIGGVDDLERVVVDHGVQRLLVAFGPTGEQEMVATLRAASLLELELHVVPRFFELGLAPAGPDIEQIWGIPLYRVRRAALRDAAWKIKRAIDVLVSTLALVVLAPVLGLLALLVRLSSPGPVLFRQVRIGQHGRPIEVLKFRTLRVNPDSDITWSVEDDPRQTPVGKWLRRLSLDELPQLWNVLRGDMSLVGPRPERPHFVNRFSAQVSGYKDRHRLPVGLSGLAQVHGLRGDTSIEERARFDNYYIEHWSPWEDCKIALRTAGSLVRDAMSSRGTKVDPAEAAEQAAAVGPIVIPDTLPEALPDAG